MSKTRAEQLGKLFRRIEAYANDQDVKGIADEMADIYEKWDKAAQELTAIAAHYSLPKMPDHIDK